MTTHRPTSSESHPPPPRQRRPEPGSESLPSGKVTRRSLYLRGVATMVLSAALHAAVLLTTAGFAPTVSSSDEDLITQDQRYLMQRYLDADAHEEAATPRRATTPVRRTASQAYEDARDFGTLAAARSHELREGPADEELALDDVPLLLGDLCDAPADSIPTALRRHRAQQHDPYTVVSLMRVPGHDFWR